MLNAKALVVIAGAMMVLLMVLAILASSGVIR
jgi:hypothetical protein